MPSVLTEDGVSILYQQRSVTKPKLQVLFMAKDESVWFVRVSDGKHISPVAVVNTEPNFRVGSVICITEGFIKCWDEGESLVFYDCNLAHLYIKGYTIIEENVETLYGNLNPNETYRDALYHVKDQLIQKDPKLLAFFEEEPEREKAMICSERLRELGNRFFKQNDLYEALARYDMAKAKDMYDHRVWANSSMAHLQLKNYKESEKDALVAIKLNLFFDKAYYRAVSAARAQCNHEGAMRSSKAGLLLTGNYDKLQDLYTEIQAEISDQIREGGYTCGNSVYIRIQSPAERHSAKIIQEMWGNLLEEKDDATQHLSARSKLMNVGKNKDRNCTVFKDFTCKANNVVEVTDGGKCVVQVKEIHKELGKAKIEEVILHSPTTVKTEHAESKERKPVNEGKREERKEQKKKDEVKKKSEDKIVEKKRLEEEKKSIEILESKSYPNNIFHENLKEGRRLYECGQYRQAGEIYTKNLVYITLGLEEEEQNEQEEVRIIKFLVGLCKVRSGRQWIIEGMQHLKSLVQESCTVKCPAAHYWLGFGFQEIVLKQMAHHHGQCCLDMIGKLDHVDPMYWPHTRDLIPMTERESLLKMASQLIEQNFKNCYEYDEEEALRTWNTLPVEPVFLLQRLNMSNEFYQQRKLMENIINAQICPRMRDLMVDIVNKRSDVKVAKEPPRRKPLIDLPQPKTRCRYKNCKNTQGGKNPKEDIFPTDPNFKGFLDVACEDYCVVSYHPCCWKAYKEEQESQFGKKMTDRDFLGMLCMTPDCSGKICSIVIHDETGKIKLDIRDKKNTSSNAKQKKKKEKKKEKQAAQAKVEQKEKKKSKNESICEELPVLEEVEENCGVSSALTASNTISAKVLKPAVPLPIDPESLQTGQITILKPGADETEEEVTKSKKNKKKNKKKSKPTPISVDEIIGDPLEERNDLECTNSYIARVQRLRKQRQAQEEEDRFFFGSSQDENARTLPWLDEENPFYLPKHLQNNPVELEQHLQNKMVLLSSSVIDREVVQNLLEFVYDWLKVIGPVSYKDSQLRDYITENFPDEAKIYINQCGGITDFLMQCSKFAMVDDIICVREHVMVAQERALSACVDTSSYPVFMISDGCKARKLEQLLEDGKSSCSSTSTVSSFKPVGAERLVENSSSTRYEDVGIDMFEAASSEVNDNLQNTRDKAGITCKKLNISTEDLSEIYHQEERDDKMKAENMEYCKETNGSWGMDTSMEHQCSQEEAENEWQSFYGTERGQVSPAFRNKPKISAVYAVDGSSEENKATNSSKDRQLKTVSSVLEHEDTEDDNEDKINRKSQSEGDAEEESQIHIDGQEEFDSDFWNEYRRTIAENKVLASQNEDLKDKFHQLKVKNSVEINTLKKEIEELYEQNQKLEKEKKTLSSQKDAENKKLQNDIKRLTDECKAATSQSHSQQISIDTFKDRNYELERILTLETETSLKRQQTISALEESLSAATKRAQDAEIKYMSVRTDLLERLFNREILRLEEDVQHMRLLLHQTAEDTTPDRKTVTRAIVACDEKIKWFKDNLNIIVEEGTQMLKVIMAGRPLSAFPTGDLQIPFIPEIYSVTAFFGVAQKQRNYTGNVIDARIDEESSEEKGKPKATVDSPVLSVSSSPSPGTETKMAHQVNTSGPPPGFVSGAIPKGVSNSSPHSTPDIPDSSCHASTFSDANKLFVGQLPWTFRESDLKELFKKYGEVVAVTIIDKVYNTEGKPVPKHGYVTFRHKESRQRALDSRPIMIDGRVLNVQEKESRKSGNVTITAGMGLDNISSGGASSAYGLSEISLNVDAAKEVIPKVLPLNPPLAPPVNPAFTLNNLSNAGLPKPKFQTLRGTDSAGTIGPIPKMGRPQAKQNSGSKSPLLMTPKPELNNFSYQKLIEVCQNRLGSDYALMDIHRSLRELRKQNKNVLMGLSQEGVVQKVEAMLQRTKRNGSVGPSVAPWADSAMDSKEKTKWGTGDYVLTAEEQCSICLEAMETSPTCALPCCHTFHEVCIKDWLKRSSNCPNCRNFTLMNDEYPSLK